jgi:hypothetical protein
MLNDTDGERIIKKYNLGSIELIYAKIRKEKIDKIRELHPNLIIEENVRYKILNKI